MRNIIRFTLGFILIFAFCMYAQKMTMQNSTGKAPFYNSHANYGPMPLLDEPAYANDNSTSSNISIPIPEGTPFTTLGSFSAPNFAASMCMGGDLNYYLIDVAPALYLFDPNTGTCTLIGNITGMGGDQPNGITYDFTTDTYFMVSSSAFYSLDINTLQASLIGSFSITGLMIDLCVDINGTIYAYDVDITPGAANGYIIDKTTGALTPLGYVGFTPNYGQGMTYDYTTQTIYLAAFNSDTFAGELRTMDPNTGMTTLLYSWGDQIAPFASSSIPNPCDQPAASNPNPPSGATDISVDGVTLTWDNGAGAVSIEVWFDGNQVYSGAPITSWPTGALDYFTTYTWKIVTWNAECHTDVSWSFKTEQNPNLCFVTDNFYPQSVDYWTGTTDGSSKTDVSEVRGWNLEDGWFMFDLSSIPANAVIDSARFYGYVNYTYYPYWSGTPLPGLNPLTATASELEQAIVANDGQGVAYIYSNESSAFSTGWHNYLMGTTANQDIQAGIAQGWFAMGMDSRDNSTTYYINWDGWAQTNHPYMKISYHYDCGGPTVDFTDNFDSYTVGEQLACQNSTDWTTWDLSPCNLTTDPYISDNYSWTPDNTVVIVQNNDLVHIFDANGPLTTGQYYASFLAYIPAGKAGYFNTLAVFDGGISPSWAMECYFDQGGAGRLIHGDIVNFTWPEATWFQVIVRVDLDADEATFMMATNPDDLTEISTWQWTQGGTIPLSLDANDIFGATANDEMYVDNYWFKSVMPPIIPVEFTAFTANVSNGNVVLNWATASEINNRGFEVQRNSGSGFETVGFVQGNGTSTQAHNYSYTDKSVAEGNYSYRLRQVDFDGTSAYSNTVEVEVVAPKVFALEQNYPNPFNPTTQINFSLAADSKVSLKVFNILGQEVMTLLSGDMAAGSHFVTFNASKLSSGVYIYKLEANGVNGSKFNAIKKMVLTK